jgi:hypothetical protein
MKKTLFSLSFIFLMLLTAFIYAWHFNLLEIFYEPVAKIIPPPAGDTDPFLKHLRERQANLERLETFWQKRIETKENKDYYLVISLLDSMFWLDMGGINVHESRIAGYELSPSLLVKRPSRQVHVWLKTSFFIQELWATIPKYPIRTKDISGTGAASDSLDFRPSALDSTDIFVVFCTNNSLKIGFRQPDPVHTGNPNLKKQIPLISDELDLPIMLSDSLEFTKLLGAEWVIITAAPADIIAVYRALDINAQLVIGI